MNEREKAVVDLARAWHRGDGSFQQLGAALAALDAAPSSSGEPALTEERVMKLLDSYGEKMAVAHGKRFNEFKDEVLTSFSIMHAEFEDRIATIEAALSRLEASALTENRAAACEHRWIIRTKDGQPVDPDSPLAVKFCWLCGVLFDGAPRAEKRRLRIACSLCGAEWEKDHQCAPIQPPERDTYDPMNPADFGKWERDSLDAMRKVTPAATPAPGAQERQELGARLTRIWRGHGEETGIVESEKEIAAARRDALNRVIERLLVRAKAFGEPDINSSDFSYQGGICNAISFVRDELASLQASPSSPAKPEPK